MASHDAGGEGQIASPRASTAHAAGLAAEAGAPGGSGEIPRVGVSLAGLERFAAAIAAQAPGGALGDITTDEANKLAMAHLTGARRCAYSDLLGGDRELVGEATVFLSHAWAKRFATLVACVREADAALRAPGHPRHIPGATPYFWVDVAVNDQFRAPSRPFTWWQTVFRESVERIGHTVVALEWERPLPLGRVWCLWEMFCSTMGAGAGEKGCIGSGDEVGDEGAAAAPHATAQRSPTLLELSLPADSAGSFRNDLEENYDSLATKLGRIDLRNADAFHGGSCSRNASGVCCDVAAGKLNSCPNDKGKILAAIAAAPGGIDDVTKRVIGGLRAWMISAARGALANIIDESSRKASALQLNLARLLRQSGQLGEAEDLARDSADERRRALGGEHVGTLDSIEFLAAILVYQSRLAEAAPLFCEVLHGRRCVLGNEHRDTLISMNNLARLLYEQGKVAEAEPLFREVLDCKRRTLGDGDRSTLTGVNNLARLLQARGKLAEAEPLFREALVGSQSALGGAHPDTLNSISNLAGLLQDRGELAEAEALCREALGGWRRTLGVAHPDTLRAMNCLGNLRQEQGALAEAEALKREALAGRRGVLGGAHTDTLISLRDVADLLVTVDSPASLAEAAALEAEALAGLRRALGGAHANTLQALRVHGCVLAAQGDAAGAVEALRASIAGLRAIGNAAEARKSARKLAASLRALGDEAGAAAALDDTMEKAAI